jgi:hypothetical protein
MLYHSSANGVYLCPKGRIAQATDLRRLQKCFELLRAKEAELSSRLRLGLRGLRLGRFSRGVLDIVDIRAREDRIRH